MGRREALKVCEEINSSINEESSLSVLYRRFCPVDQQRTAHQYAALICQKYRTKYPSLLSGSGRQLRNKNSGCIVACEDRMWKDIHYQMDAFEDGKFPFGTDCSFDGKTGYCLNGKCIHFDPRGISYDTAGEWTSPNNSVTSLPAPYR